MPPLAFKQESENTFFDILLWNTDNRQRGLTTHPVHKVVFFKIVFYENKSKIFTPSDECHLRRTVNTQQRLEVLLTIFSLLEILSIF